jgi:hypothetical protein
MAAYTSTSTGGNWSAASTWTTTPTNAGGPGAGDTVTIANGATVTVDSAAGASQNGWVIVGSNGSQIGPAVTINGASSSSYGTLQVAGGCTLQLRGYDTAGNPLMLINQYGQFNPQPGSTVLGDTSGDYASIILNKGQISAIGTAGSPVTFSSPAANYSWATQVASESFSGTGFYYDFTANIYCGVLANPWVSNSYAAATGPGSFGASSLSFSAQSPSTILQTEVSSLAAVNAPGTYYVSYDIGAIFFYATQNINTATAKYAYLTLTGTWGIQSLQNTSYNSAVFRYCNFSCMGQWAANAEKFALQFAHKRSAAANSGGTDRILLIEYCTFSNTSQCVELQSDNLGTSSDPLLITNNTFGMVRGNYTYGSCIGSNIGSPSSPNSYISISNNQIYQRYPFYTAYGVASASSQIQCAGLVFNANTGVCPGFLTSAAPAVVHPGGQATNNVMSGLGWAFDSRWIQKMGGTAGSPFLIKGNQVDHCKRWVHWESYLTIDSNSAQAMYHHGMPGTTNDDVAIAGVTIQNNVLFGSYSTNLSGSAFIELGYNHRHWLDGAIVANNTAVGQPNGVVGIGDLQDNGGNVLITNAAIVNNLAYNAGTGGLTGGQQGVGRRADSTNYLVRAHILMLDYGLYYNVSSQYSGPCAGGTFTLSGSNYNTLSSGRNLVGVALSDPTYVSGTTGLGIAYTCTTRGVTETIALSDSGGSGTAVSIVNSHGQCTAASTNSNTGGYNTSSTITDASQGWSTTLNSASCPRARWFVVTGGTGSGQIRAVTNNTATTLTVVPVLTTALDATSTYTVYESEVVLSNSGATNSLRAAIDARTFPFGTSASDTGIGLTLHDAGNVNPNLVNPAGLTPASFKLASGSPAIGAATSYDCPPLDYFGGARPQAWGYDIGFADFVATGIGVGFFPRGMSSLQPISLPTVDLYRYLD